MKFPPPGFPPGLPQQEPTLQLVTPLNDVQVLCLMAAQIESGQRILPEEDRAPANLVVAKAYELTAEVVTLKNTPLLRTFLAHARKREELDPQPAPATPPNLVVTSEETQ